MPDKSAMVVLYVRVVPTAHGAHLLLFFHACLMSALGQRAGRCQPLQVTSENTKAESSLWPQVIPMGSDPPARRSAADSGAIQARGCGQQRTKRPFLGVCLPKGGLWAC